MIGKIEKNTVLTLQEQIAIQQGSVVSQNLVRHAGFEITLYSFAKGESITEQTSFGDTFYYVIEGTALFGEREKSERGNANSAFLAKKGMPHSIKAEDELKVLYMQVFEDRQKKEKEEMFIQNFEQNKLVEIKEQVTYEQGKIVSKSLVQRDDLTMTLFAFDAGEGVSTHAAPGDAFVIVLDGSAEITIDGVTSVAKEGQSIIMPANIPHSVTAVTPYKMLLIVVKAEKK